MEGREERRGDERMDVEKIKYKNKVWHLVRERRVVALRGGVQQLGAVVVREPRAEGRGVEGLVQARHLEIHRDRDI
jgi:hypothetical protein